MGSFAAAFHGWHEQGLIVANASVATLTFALPRRASLLGMQGTGAAPVPWRTVWRESATKRWEGSNGFLSKPIQERER